RVLSENAHEAFERLRAQGKARFLGVSTNTPNLEQVAQAALESDRFDALMLAYHRSVWPQLSHILARAAARDVGVIATEIMQGARREGLLGQVAERGSYAQAAFRWALKDPHVAALAVRFGGRRCIDEYLYASGQRGEPRPLPVEA